MHDVHNNLSPSNISNLFSSASAIHTYNTRSSSAGNLYTKYSRLTHQIKYFSRRGVLIWNSIPPDLRKLSKPYFKNKMLTSNSQSGGGLCWHTDYYVSFTKSYIARFIVYRVYIIGLRYRHDCDQFKYSIYVNLKLYLYNM